VKRFVLSWATSLKTRGPLEQDAISQRPPVMPANAGIQYVIDRHLDSRLRGNDNIVDRPFHVEGGDRTVQSYSSFPLTY
jgi:hypothetical protein